MNISKTFHFHIFDTDFCIFYPYFVIIQVNLNLLDMISSAINYHLVKKNPNNLALNIEFFVYLYTTLFVKNIDIV